MALFGVAQADARTTEPRLSARPCDASTGLCLIDRPTEPADPADGGPSVPSSGSRGPWVQVSAGDNHTCGLTVTHGVKCWGDNDNGQLGDGTLVDRSTPVQVQGLTEGVTWVSAGGDHTCALKTDTTVVCWGDDRFGPLGNGGTTNLGDPTLNDSSIPVPVNAAHGAVTIPLAGVTSIDAGGEHTCAVKTDATVVCWGNDNRGQLGDAQPFFRTGPVAVAGLTGVASVSAGDEFTCAVKTDATAVC